MKEEIHSMTRARLLLADSQALVVEALTTLLAPEFEVVGTATNGFALMKKAAELKPDVVILDLNLPSLNGADAGKRLKTMLPRTKIIVLTMNEDFIFAEECLRQWASAYLLKRCTRSELVKAIHDVWVGKTYVTPMLSKRLLKELIRNPHQNYKAHVTKRQKQVLQLLAEGHTMEEIGAILDITKRTVAFHKYQMMQEHGLRSHSDVVMFAIKQRVILMPA